jgi:hypothetical protein
MWFARRHQNQIAASLFPIPLFWLAAYICVWLARWLRWSFEKEKA